jgi:hypothetical protein
MARYLGVRNQHIPWPYGTDHPTPRPPFFASLAKARCQGSTLTCLGLIAQDKLFTEPIHAYTCTQAACDAVLTSGGLWISEATVRMRRTRVVFAMERREGVFDDYV